MKHIVENIDIKIKMIKEDIEKISRMIEIQKDLLSKEPTSFSYKLSLQSMNLRLESLMNELKVLNEDFFVKFIRISIKPELPRNEWRSSEIVNRTKLKFGTETSSDYKQYLSAFLISDNLVINDCKYDNKGSDRENQIYAFIDPICIDKNIMKSAS